MASNELYEIFAIRYAEMKNRTRADNFKVADDHAAPMPIDYFIWVIRNEARTIVVDTGFGRQEAQKRGRQLLQTPEQALAALIQWNETNAFPKWNVRELLHKVEDAFKT